MQQIQFIRMLVRCGAHMSVDRQVVWKKCGNKFTRNNEINITVSCFRIRVDGAVISAVTKKPLDSQ